MDHTPAPPRAALESLLDGGLRAGEFVFVSAPAGTGKTAFLVQAALEALLAGRRVLHVALDATVDRVHAHYDTILGELEQHRGVDDDGATKLRVERGRMIHAWPDGRFTTQRLEAGLRWLTEHMAFQPAVVVVDGLDAAARAREPGPAAPWTSTTWTEDLAAAEVASFVGLLQRVGASAWVGARQDGGGLERAFSAGASARFGLRASGRGRELVVQGVRGQSGPTLVLHPETSRILDTPAAGQQLAGPPLPAADCTLYSGAAAGSEALFGEQAERHGVREVHFSFSGHTPARERGIVELGDAELRRGDVSLAYVSRRMNRTYTSSPSFRRVLQSIWHMVDNAEQVFVLGAIQEDGTVRGGTGWGAELARLANKPLFVYDQDRRHWFQWSGTEQRWASITPPRITHANICGTGTRFVTDDGRAAIESLFNRSFAR